MLWIYRSRLPLGHFSLESEGAVEAVELRLSLWNAELTGLVRTSQGSYTVRGFSHSELDVIDFEVDAKEAESIKITWHPDVPLAPVKKGETSTSWEVTGVEDGSQRLMASIHHSFPEHNSLAVAELVKRLTRQYQQGWRGALPE